MGMSREELRRWAESWNEPVYRADQLFQWVYHKRATIFDEMTNLPKAFRAAMEARATIGRLRVAARIPSEVDDTVKYLFELQDGERIESVLLYDGDRVTLCVSSQVGCAQGCSFCATAQLGIVRNMTAGEILSQVVQVEEEIGVGTITNIVFMGMGEPLANYSALLDVLRILSAPEGLCIAARRITVSTSGLVPAIDRFTREGLRVGLALSLNATTDPVRNRLIPSNRRYTIAGVLDSCSRWTEATGRRLTVEYVLLRDVNDSIADAERLCQLLRTLPSKVNLIPFNPVANSDYNRPSAERVDAFQRILLAANIVAIVRDTKGQDIAAACGQLRASYPMDLLRNQRAGMRPADTVRSQVVAG
ncbi:23S rRNA (adenine(2503)-C(2))-methyltransferase RlmN [Candidatus Poribacteria bacterium]|nr:23S rRNA (adenine(2503)-C(2))-methyltransferase RlmN [Candidatus Poribacteria bacterium]